MRVCEGEPASFGQVGQCDLGPLRQKAFNGAIFLLTGVAVAIALVLVVEREGGGRTRSGSQMKVGRVMGTLFAVSGFWRFWN